MEHNYKLADFKNILNDSDTDILERIVSISLWNVEEMPAVIVHRVESMINRMIAEHEKKNNIIIPLEDMRLGMYMNIDTKETYIGYYSDKECITGKEIIVAENADYAEIKQYFFDVLQLCVNEQIKKIRKYA